MYICKLTLTSANVVIFCQSESSPNIDIICIEFVCDVMQMRHNCGLQISVSMLEMDAAITEIGNVIGIGIGFKAGIVVGGGV